jgi:hypothetical protein
MSNRHQFVRHSAAVLLACGLISSLPSGLLRLLSRPSFQRFAKLGHLVLAQVKD